MILAVPLFASRRYWTGHNVGGRVARLALVAVVGACAAIALPNRLNWHSDSPYLDSARGMVDYKTGSLSLQGGVRHLTIRQTATRELVANTTNLSATNPALRGAQFGTGAIVNRDNNAQETAFAFGANCVSCHGSDMKGNSRKGIPNLTDNIWLYDFGRVSDIERTVLYGIRAGVGKSRLKSMRASPPDRDHRRRS